MEAIKAVFHVGFATVTFCVDFMYTTVYIYIEGVTHHQENFVVFMACSLTAYL